jgi:hypothetical protein
MLRLMKGLTWVALLLAYTGVRGVLAQQTGEAQRRSCKSSAL